MQVTPVNSNLNQTNTNYNKNKERKIKAGVVATSALGVATALAHISKRQGFSLNPSKIAKTPIKTGQFLGYIQNITLKGNWFIWRVLK